MEGQYAGVLETSGEGTQAKENTVSELAQPPMVSPGGWREHDPNTRAHEAESKVYELTRRLEEVTKQRDDLIQTHRQLSRGYDELAKLLGPVLGDKTYSHIMHTSAMDRRCDVYPSPGDPPNKERIFRDAWRKANRRERGLNGGCGLLELLLSPHTERGFALFRLTQRDATVAASVIQWLGTNCGQGFLFEVEREIERQREKK
jgi:hypothetical protein